MFSLFLRTFPDSIGLAMPRGNQEIAQYVENEMDTRLKTERLKVRDLSILKNIQETLITGAQDMFLWVYLQLETICAQRSDEEILQCLLALPRDLPDTFDRLLRKVRLLGCENTKYCQKIFKLVVAALRPLSVLELREALSIKPGDLDWSERRLVNDIEDTVRCCGPFLTVDEDELTVHFTHESVRAYITQGNLSQDLQDFAVRYKAANTFLGEICATYLNFPVLAQQVAKVNESAKIENSHLFIGSLPLSVLSTTLLGHQYGDRFLATYAKTGRAALGTQIGLLCPEPSTKGHRQEGASQADFRLLDYSRDFWLLHSKQLDLARSDAATCFLRLVHGHISYAQPPWDISQEVPTQRSKWILDNEHECLLWLLILKELWIFMRTGIFHVKKYYHFLHRSILSPKMQEVVSEELWIYPIIAATGASDALLFWLGQWRVETSTLLLQTKMEAMPWANSLTYLSWFEFHRAPISLNFVAPMQHITWDEYWVNTQISPQYLHFDMLSQALCISNFPTGEPSSARTATWNPIAYAAAVSNLGAVRMIITRSKFQYDIDIHSWAQAIYAAFRELACICVIFNAAQGEHTEVIVKKSHDIMDYLFDLLSGHVFVESDDGWHPYAYSLAARHPNIPPWVSKAGYHPARSSLPLVDCLAHLPLTRITGRQIRDVVRIRDKTALERLEKAKLFNDQL